MHAIYTRTLFTVDDGMKGTLLLLLLCLKLPVYGYLSCSLGPEIYHIKRERAGGSQQTGRCDGVRVVLERFKPCGWYLAADAFYSQGDLRGQSASGRPLESTLTDAIYEGRIGYTLYKSCGKPSFITPFGGGGYFHETNDFRPPSILPVKYTDTFNYVTAGFLSGVNFCPLLSMGINFKLRFMLNGTSKISGDPDVEGTVLKMKEEIHARLDIPLSTCLTICNAAASATLEPFFEFRHFGGQVGYPFDFIDTKFYLIGARISLAVGF